MGAQERAQDFGEIQNDILMKPGWGRGHEVEIAFHELIPCAAGRGAVIGYRQKVSLGARGLHENNLRASASVSKAKSRVRLWERLPLESVCDPRICSRCREIRAGLTRRREAREDDAEFRLCR
jgi:hypothetical protein